MRRWRLEQDRSEVGTGGGERNARRAAARADVHDRARPRGVGRAASASSTWTRRASSRSGDRREPGRREQRAQASARAGVAQSALLGAGATTTCRFGSVPSLEVTIPPRSARCRCTILRSTAVIGSSATARASRAPRVAARSASALERAAAGGPGSRRRRRRPPCARSSRAAEDDRVRQVLDRVDRVPAPADHERRDRGPESVA